MKYRTVLLARLLTAQSDLRRRFQAAVPSSLQAEFAEFGGITVHQLEVVRRLLLGDEMTMHEVAAAQGIGLSGATQLVDRLERRGLVMRTRDPRDRRVQRVVPTDRAKAIARRFKAGMSRAAEEVLDVLDDDELQTYVELTERVVAAWREDTEPAERRASASPAASSRPSGTSRFASAGESPSSGYSSTGDGGMSVRPVAQLG